jgi:hypothetical protein
MYFRRKFQTSGLFFLKSGMSADTNDFYRSVAKVESLQDPGQAFKPIFR